MLAILKYPGSKWQIAKWIIGHFPEGYQNMTYLEPFFGSGSIFFNKDRSRIETINDLDDNVVNLFKVMREWPEELAYQISMTPWSRTEYDISYQPASNEVEQARRFMVRTWQAFGCLTSCRTGWRNNITAENRTVQKFHSKLPDEMLSMCNRLRHTKNETVQIEHQDAFKLIERYNRTDVLMYLDPPYLISTRHGKMYKHEFTDDDHIRLLNFCRESRAKIIISGYENSLYEQYLKNWNKDDITTMCEGGKTRKEIIWMNYKISGEGIQMSFSDFMY